MEQAHGIMFAPRAIFDEALYKAIFRLGDPDNRWDSCLAERSIGFEPALTTDQIVSLSVGSIPSRNCNRLLQAKFSDIVGNLPERLTVTDSRIDHVDQINRNNFHELSLIVLNHQATSERFTRRARSKNASRLTNR